MQKCLGLFSKVDRLFQQKMIFRPKRDILCRIETSAKNWLFWLQKSFFCDKTPKHNYMDLKNFV